MICLPIRIFRSLPAPVRSYVTMFQHARTLCVCFLLLGLCARRENYRPTFFFGYSVVNFYTTLVECVSEKWTKERREGGVGNIREKADEKRKKKVS